MTWLPFKLYITKATIYLNHLLILTIIFIMYRKLIAIIRNILKSLEDLS